MQDAYCTKWNCPTSSLVRCERMRRMVQPVSSRWSRLPREHQHAQLPFSAIHKIFSLLIGPMTLCVITLLNFLFIVATKRHFRCHYVNFDNVTFMQVRAGVYESGRRVWHNTGWVEGGRHLNHVKMILQYKLKRCLKKML